MPKPSLSQIYQNVCRDNFTDSSPESFVRGGTEDVVQFYNSLENFVANKAKAISTHQIRNIYQKIAKAKNPTDLQVMLPKLTYVAARLDNRNANDVVALFYGLVRAVEEHEHVKNFQTLAEAIVAYHKYYCP
jgi:CRISPR type III-A-associated protein Csm2